MPMPITITMIITSSRAGIIMPPDRVVTKVPKVRPRLVLEAMPTTMPAPAQGIATAMALRAPESSACTESATTERTAPTRPAEPCSRRPSQPRVNSPRNTVSQTASRVAELSARPAMIW